MTQPVMCFPAEPEALALKNSLSLYLRTYFVSKVPSTVGVNSEVLYFPKKKFVKMVFFFFCKYNKSPIK